MQSSVHTAIAVFLCEHCMCDSISARASGPCLCHFCEAHSLPQVFEERSVLFPLILLKWICEVRALKSTLVLITGESLYASNKEHANTCSAIHSSCVIWLEKIPKFPSSHSHSWFSFLQARFSLWVTDPCGQTPLNYSFEARASPQAWNKMRNKPLITNFTKLSLFSQAKFLPRKTPHHPQPFFFFLLSNRSWAPNLLCKNLLDFSFTCPFLASRES